MTIFKYIARIGLIINWKTFLITFLAIASTSFCLHYDIKADFPLTLIGTAIVFPIVFSIDGAYKRREVALDYIQSPLENPFDQRGEDDVHINVDKFIRNLE